MSLLKKRNLLIATVGIVSVISIVNVYKSQVEKERIQKHFENVQEFKGELTKKVFSENSWPEEIVLNLINRIGSATEKGSLGTDGQLRVPEGS